MIEMLINLCMFYNSSNRLKMTIDDKLKKQPKKWEAGDQFNIHIGKDDVECMNEFEQILTNTGRDRSKTVKYLISLYIKASKGKQEKFEEEYKKAIEPLLL